jgi:dethiobiotin synthetase
MSRPRQLVVMAGTGTEVGKTWVGCRLLELARMRGQHVAVRKPAQSFETASALLSGSDPSPNQPTDAEFLAAATGESPHTICPEHRWYAVSMAPPMAADVLGRGRLSISELIAEIRWPAGVDLGCVEIAGGLRSPITHDADSVELIARLAPDAVVLVADAGLGTINSVRLSLAAVPRMRVHVYLNRFDATNDLHARNRAWLLDVYGIATSVTITELLDRIIR